MSGENKHYDAGESVEWGTPEELLVPVRDFFGTIDLDPCSGHDSIVNALVEFKLPDKDGLARSWAIHHDRDRKTKAFINPPYGRTLVRGDLGSVYSQKQFTRACKAWRSHHGDSPGAPTSEYWTSTSEGRELVIGPLAAKQFRSTTIGHWIRKTEQSYQKDNVEGILLIPTATDTANWQQVIFPQAAGICFIKGRVHFRGAGDGPAPMATAFVYFGDFPDEFRASFAGHGRVVLL